MFTAEVPGVILHRPGGQLAGETRLGVLLVAGYVGPGYAEQDGGELAPGLGIIGEHHLGSDWR